MTKIFCDKCKKELSDWVEKQERQVISIRGGYGSIFGDGASVYIELCQKCMFEMLKGYELLNQKTTADPQW